MKALICRLAYCGDKIVGGTLECEMPFAPPKGTELAFSDGTFVQMGESSIEDSVTVESLIYCINEGCLLIETKDERTDEKPEDLKREWTSLGFEVEVLDLD